MNILSKSAICLGLLCCVTASAQVTLMPVSTPNSATNISLAWDPSPSAEVTGYYIYYGTNSGTYLGKLDAGAVTSACVGVQPGTDYFFAVDAYDAAKNESPFSNEITYSAPTRINQAPLTLSPAGPLACGSTTLLSATGGSGSGSLTFEVLNGPGYLTGSSRNLLVTTGTGTVLVAASKAGDSTYLETATTNAIAVTSAPQSLYFSTIPQQKQTNVVTLAATASSLLPVSFKVQSGPGVVSGDQLSFTGAGTVVVVAYQNGNSVYQAATPVSQTVEVFPVAWPVITANMNLLAFAGTYGSTNPSPASLALNNTGEFPLNYAVTTAYSPNGAGWLSISPSTGSISAYGSATMTHSVNLKGLAAGVYYATNTANSAEATNRAVQWVVQLTVSRAAQSALAFAPLSVQVYGTTNVLSVTGELGTGPVSYQVLSGPGIIAGGSNLVVTAGTGQILVQATKAADANYAGTNISASVAAAKASQSITFPSIPAQKNTNVVTLVATASSELPVSFAVVKGPGVISGTELKFTGTGTVIVSARQPGDDNYLAAPSVTTSISVSSYLKGPSNMRVSSK